jgi:hypothetical protein
MQRIGPGIGLEVLFKLKKKKTGTKVYVQKLEHDNNDPDLFPLGYCL